MAEFDFSIDISDFDRKSVLVVVVVPYGDTFQRQLSTSTATLLINTDKPQAEEDIAPPEYYNHS